MAWLNSKLEALGVGRIVITGGFAVELYTGRTYRTMDVDVICDGVKCHEVVEEFLREIGERIARGYIPRDEELALKSIDIVSTSYARKAPPVKIKVNDMHIYIEPPEILIAMYLAAWKHWNSTEDRDKALWLLIATREIIDYKLLSEEVKSRNAEDKLNELMKLIKQRS